LDTSSKRGEWSEAHPVDVKSVDPVMRTQVTIVERRKKKKKTKKKEATRRQRALKRRRRTDST